MPSPKAIQPTLLSLKDHPTLKEAWVEQQLVENPALLRLGEVEVRDRQRAQPKAGRLDLLLEDIERKRRYEVEIQLGKCDESHIIRAIEYWDLEKKRYPHYEHCAVIVAEDVTSRFLNVINLLNGTIPIIVIKMEAYQIQEGVALIFSKIIDELHLGPDDTGTGSSRGTYTRADWENENPKQMLEMIDELFAGLKAIDSKYDLKYNKYYIGVSYAGSANNIVQFRPKKNFLKLTVYLPQSDELEKKMDEAGVEVLDYDTKWRTYTFRVTPDSYRKNKGLFAGLMNSAYDFDAAD
ncbi:MAG TPA: hypothetical protein VK815_15270 [Candidatus Acidoferrales bacterium]|jgi:hypothetical protein|nr:hypothetical protein [Candidatus Acidoferrales bacterium]